MNSECMDIVVLTKTNGWVHDIGRWRCKKCGSLTKGSYKPKTSRDYARQGIGKTCSLELIRVIMEN
jgi:hypothetical protein